MRSAGLKPQLDRIGGEALREVFETLLGLPASELEQIEETAFGTPGERLRVTVTLAGPRVGGAVRLSFPPAFAVEGVACLLGAERLRTPGDGEVGDFAAELGNMVAGRVAAHLGREGHSCELGIPQVMTPPAVGEASVRASRPGSPSPPAREEARPTDSSVTDWSCHGHRLALEIQLRYGPT